MTETELREYATRQVRITVVNDPDLVDKLVEKYVEETVERLIVEPEFLAYVETVHS